MIFSQIRKATVGTFIAATVLFVFLAVLSIWELVSRDFLEKSLVSLGVLSFGAVLIIIATLERDNLLVNPLKRKSTEKTGGRTLISLTLHEQRRAIRHLARRRRRKPMLARNGVKRMLFS